MKKTPKKTPKPVPPARLKAELASFLSATGLEAVSADHLLAFLSKGPPVRSVFEVGEKGKKESITVKWAPPATPRNLAVASGMRLKKRLDEIQADHEDGKKPRAAQSKKIAILKAAVLCGKSGLPLPRWITNGLDDIHGRYATCEVKTMDEAFGVSRPTGFHAAPRNKFHKTSFPVFLRVEILRSEGRSLGDNLFDKVGEEFNISGKKTRDYYYWWKNAMRTAGRITPKKTAKRESVTAR